MFLFSIFDDKIQEMNTAPPTKRDPKKKKSMRRIGQNGSAKTPVAPVKKKAPDSLDFHDCESMMYRKVFLYLFSTFSHIFFLFCSMKQDVFFKIVDIFGVNLDLLHFFNGLMLFLWVFWLDALVVLSPH